MRDLCYLQVTVRLGAKVGYALGYASKFKQKHNFTYKKHEKLKQMIVFDKKNWVIVIVIIRPVGESVGDAVGLFVGSAIKYISRNTIFINKSR